MVHCCNKQIEAVVTPFVSLCMLYMYILVDNLKQVIWLLHCLLCNDGCR